MKHKTLVLLIVILVMSTLVMMFARSSTRDPENINAPVVCASLWVDDVSTFEETVDCIANYVENRTIENLEVGTIIV